MVITVKNAELVFVAGKDTIDQDLKSLNIIDQLHLKAALCWGGKRDTRKDSIF